jgi:hypothetical protein
MPLGKLPHSGAHVKKFALEHTIGKFPLSRGLQPTDHLSDPSVSAVCKHLESADRTPYARRSDSLSSIKVVKK